MDQDVDGFLVREVDEGRFLEGKGGGVDKDGSLMVEANKDGTWW